MKGKRRSRLEIEVDALRALDLSARDAPAALARALASVHGHVVMVAAGLAEKALAHRVRLDDALEAALASMMEDPLERDPGCHAKVAVLRALLASGGMRSEPYLRAVGCVQAEPGYPDAVDTATGVRSLGLAGLVSTLHPDAILWAGELLADDASPVRATAVDAIARLGQRDGAALLLMKLRLGDDDPAVLDAAARALLELAEDRGLEVLGRLLASADELLAEVAAFSLAGSRRPAAVRLVIDAARASALSDDRARFVRALGVSRLDEARSYLLDLVRAGGVADARNAIAALAVHRHDESLVRAVREAALESGHRLGDALAEAFEPRD